MSNVQERVKALRETRLRVWDDASGLLDRAGHEHRDLDAEEQAQWGRLNDRMGVLEREANELEQREADEVEAAKIREAQGVSYDREPDDFHRSGEAAKIAQFVRGAGSGSDGGTDQRCDP